VLIIAFSTWTVSATANTHCTAQEAQQALRASGINTGPTDGIVGRKTRAAIRSYQRKSSLPVTGTLDHATCGALMGASTQTKADETQAANTAAMKAEAAKVEAMQAEAAKVEAMQAEAAKAEAMQAEAAKAEAMQAEAAKAEAMKAESAKTEAAKTETAKAPATKTKSTKSPLNQYRTAFGMLKSRLYDRSAGLFEDYIANNPRHDRVPDALYWLGDAYYELERDDEARASWEAVIEQFSDHRHARTAAERLKSLK
jgi:TolA-binding protein